eukprot:gb/GECH01001654.1/.p1 GENE.gb/GECH01001654.1/~~gb/GECH01001654.1/.p1  ORF type:complete len:736 (+),score=104.08 gb/GECH01001654.1/:1-2208(+)
MKCPSCNQECHTKLILLPCPTSYGGHTVCYECVRNLPENTSEYPHEHKHCSLCLRGVKDSLEPIFNKNSNSHVMNENDRQDHYDHLIREHDTNSVSDNQRDDSLPQMNTNENNTIAYIENKLQHQKYNIVISILSDNITNAYLQLNGLLSIGNYWAGCEQFPFAARDITDMSDLLSKIMLQHKNDSEIQMTACILLKHLGKCYEYANILLQNGAEEWIKRTMRLFENNDEVQQEACLALVKLGSEGENTDILMRGNILELILQSMGNHLDNPNIQRIGCDFLILLNTYVDDYLTYFIDMNTYDTIQTAMNKHFEHPEIQKNGFAAIGNLSCNSQYANLLIETEFENFFLRAVQNHSKHSEVLINAFSIIGNIMNNTSIDLLKKKNEISQLILKRMQEHIEDQEIQNAGCNVLCGLVDNEYCSKLMDQGIYYILSKAMNHYADNLQVQYTALKVFINLALEKEIRQRLFDCGIYELLSRAMNNHVDSPSIQQSVLLTLINLNLGHNFSNTMMICGVYHLISQAMRVHVSDSQVQDFSCRLLFNLSYDNEIKSDLVSRGADKLIQRAQDHHPDNKFIGIAYDSFIPSPNSSLSEDEQIDYCLGELREQNFEHYFSMFSKHKNNEEQQRFFLFALCKYCYKLDTETHLKLFRHGVYDYASSALEYHPYNPYVQGLFCALLQRLSNSDTTSTILLEKSAFELISEIMNRFPNDSALQSQALLTIFNFCVKESNAELCIM